MWSLCKKEYIFSCLCVSGNLSKNTLPKNVNNHCFGLKEGIRRIWEWIIRHFSLYSDVLFGMFFYIYIWQYQANERWNCIERGTFSKWEDILSTIVPFWLTCLYIHKLIPGLLLGKEILRKHCRKLHVDITRILGFLFTNSTWHHWSKFEF